MTDFTLQRDDALLHGVETGAGDLALVMQHGLGGDRSQVADNTPESAATRRLTLECRAHGRSGPGRRRPFSIAMFADDVLAACDARGLDRFVVGGISMGAAIGLRIAARHPDRVRGLVLIRPAWTFGPAPDNLRPYREMAEALRRWPPAEAKARFAGSQTGRMLAHDAPDNLASLLGFFDRRDPAVTADLMDDIAADGAGVGNAEAAALRAPTLVIGNATDYAHPLATAELLAATIPRARLTVVPPKAADKAVHVAAVKAAVQAFLDETRTRSNKDLLP